MKICSHDGWFITIISRGYYYTYRGVSPFILKKVRWNIQRGYEGRAWKILKHYKFERSNI